MSVKETIPLSKVPQCVFPDHNQANTIGIVLNSVVADLLRNQSLGLYTGEIYVTGSAARQIQTLQTVPHSPDFIVRRYFSTLFGRMLNPHPSLTRLAGGGDIDIRFAMACDLDPKWVATLQETARMLDQVFPTIPMQLNTMCLPGKRQALHINFPEISEPYPVSLDIAPFPDNRDWEFINDCRYVGPISQKQECALPVTHDYHNDLAVKSESNSIHLYPDNIPIPSINREGIADGSYEQYLLSALRAIRIALTSYPIDSPNMPLNTIKRSSRDNYFRVLTYYYRYPQTISQLRANEATAEALLIHTLNPFWGIQLMEELGVLLHIPHMPTEYKEKLLRCRLFKSDTVVRSEIEGTIPISEVIPLQRIKHLPVIQPVISTLHSLSGNNNKQYHDALVSGLLDSTLQAGALSVIHALRTNDLDLRQVPITWETTAEFFSF